MPADREGCGRPRVRKHGHRPPSHTRTLAATPPQRLQPARSPCCRRGDLAVMASLRVSPAQSCHRRMQPDSALPSQPVRHLTRHWVHLRTTSPDTGNNVRDPPPGQGHQPAPRPGQLHHSGLGHARPRFPRLARLHHERRRAAASSRTCAAPRSTPTTSSSHAP
jgi:hypothetical protein